LRDITRHHVIVVTKFVVVGASWTPIGRSALVGLPRATLPVRSPVTHSPIVPHRTTRCTLLRFACIRVIHSARYSHRNTLHVCLCLLRRYVGAFSCVLASLSVRALQACSTPPSRRTPLERASRLNVVASAASLHVSYTHAIHFTLGDGIIEAALMGWPTDNFGSTHRQT
jgi:hypothetical protein